MDRKRAPERDGGDRFAKRDRRSGKVIKVLCPYYSAGAVIGKGGEAIKQIKEESGANIQVSKNNVRFPNSDERVISISGELEALQKVVAFVQEKIRTDKVPPHVKNINTSQNDARKATCKIVVPSTCVGKIIGKSGANVNRLKDQFSVKIGTMKKEEAIAGLEERIITVESEDAANVDDCVAEMIKDVYEDERGNMDYNVDYEAFGGSSERGGGDRGSDRGGDRGGDSYGGSQPRSYGDRGSYSAPAATQSYGSASGGYGGYGSGGYGGASYGDKGGYGGGDRGYSGGDRGYSQGASYGAAPAPGGRADYGRSSGGAGGGYDNNKGSYGSSDGYGRDPKPSYGGRY